MHPKTGICETSRQFGHHHNAFGFLRLLFASLVIVSHTPELVDGNRSRELLTGWFGTISFGELAVDAFFIISGLLISTSFLSSSTILSYILKRIYRIFPAFVIASLVCVTLVGSLGGATEGTILTRILRGIANSVLLRMPNTDGAFSGSHHQALDGAMWTIPYEFRCYILIIALGVLGVLENSFLLMILVAMALLGALALPADINNRINGYWNLHTYVWAGDPIQTLRLTGLFLAGAAFRSLQHRIPLRPGLMALCGAGFIISLFWRISAEIGVAVFGSYLIFGAAALGRATVLERVNNKNDVSYGLYLYAWPIEKLLIAFGFGSSLLILGLLTWVGAVAAGAISWFVIERPAMKLVRRSKNSDGPVG